MRTCKRLVVVVGQVVQVSVQRVALPVTAGRAFLQTSPARSHTTAVAVAAGSARMFPALQALVAMAAVGRVV